MSELRKHHYLNEAFLAAWTDTCTKDGQLQVIDKSTGKAWSTRPANAAVETDLYRIDLAEVTQELSSTEIESGFGVIENAAMPVIKAILDGADVPTGNDLEDLIAFVALLTLRVPAQLRRIDEMLRKPVEVCLQRLYAEGKLPNPDDPATANQLREWFEAGAVKVQIKQNPRLGMMVSGQEELLNLLMRGHWTAIRTRPGAGDLVCSDNPLLLGWIGSATAGSSPGFGLENTAVFVPLGPSTALVGLWGDQPKVSSLSMTQVAFWNGELLNSVERFVFSRGDFVAERKTGTLETRVDVLERWADSSGTHIADGRDARPTNE